MGQTTFSGPLTAGTVKDTTGTTAGSVRNVGNAVLSQSTAIPAAAGTTTVAVLPAGSQIIDIYIRSFCQQMQNVIFCFVTSIAKHKALIACTEVVGTECDICTLSV